MPKVDQEPVEICLTEEVKNALVFYKWRVGSFKVVLSKIGIESAKQQGDTTAGAGLFNEFFLGRLIHVWRNG